MSQSIQSVGIIGAGQMGGMLIKASDRFSRGKFRLHAGTRDLSRLRSLCSSVPDLSCGSLPEVAKSVDLLIICTPPQAILEVAKQAASHMKKDAVLATISNGVSIEVIQERCGRAAVVAIPNVLNEIGRGVVPFAASSRGAESDLDLVESFFAPFSRPFRMNVENLRAATNITGCGPALLALFCAELEAASRTNLGTPCPSDLDAMLLETFAATGAYVGSGVNFEDLIGRVATHGGMTEMAVEHLRGSLPAILRSMVDAISARQKAVREHATPSASTAAVG